ncbi:MAG: PD40 domain-containing protein [Saprospiraceae bacterium]|nr:PD40 domain-containing protein [Saprospiraceae bacterium]MBK7737555.1 PD40 domain-containing protein [Saprospiraceae bacterium]
MNVKSSLTCSFLAIYCLLSAQESRLLRFPTIFNDQVAFSYAGDLYTVSANGGTARKLTNHPGQEIFARYAPDGKHIAFTGQYDGNSEIYIMPANGGEPKRLTYTATLNRDDVSDRMGPNNLCMTWKDNESIVYRGRWRDFNDWKGQLYLCNIKGGLSEQLPLDHGGFCSYNADKSKMAYNYVFREFRTWKRYRGGQADDIRIFDFQTKQSTKISDNNAQDIIPMWVGSKIYYLSDRDARMNLFCYDINTRQTKKITDFKDFDCKFPSSNGNWIVFENGGYIYKLNASTDKYEKISISLQEDFASGRTKYVNAKDYIENWDIGPDGNRAVFCARGDVFTIPAKNGAVRNMTKSSGAHDRDAAWSPNGKYIAYISDASGEDEIYLLQADGTLPAVQLTKNGDNYKYGIRWSPDSKMILYSDRKQRLYSVDVMSKDVIQIQANDYFEIRDYNWSPDSKFVCYTNPEGKNNSTIHIYSMAEKKNYAVTENWFQSYGPVFSPDGKYLFFVSERSFNPSYNNVEWNYAYFDLAKIYCIPLRKELKNPFEPKSDEVMVKDTANKKEDAKSSKSDTAKKDANANKIDFDGITERVVEIPGSPGNYFGLETGNDKLYYFRASQRDKMKWFVYDLNSQKETELGTDVNGYSFAADGKKVMVAANRNFYIIDIPSAKPNLENPLNLDDMKLWVDRSAEWNQIYNECWRQMRDFVYDPNLHGVDWKKLKTNYAQLLPYVNNRTDLTYVIGELIGELNLGHSYVGGGDYPKADRIPMGLLGAEVIKDPSGYIKVVKILKGENWDKNNRSPLTEIGVNVKEGDFILAVDGNSTKNVSDFYQLLVGTAGKQVRLKVNSKASETGSRDVTVIPIADEQKLYYYSWVQKNIAKVTAATNGRVGYLHIPNMGSEGLNEFVKYYYAQLNKEALIVDDRGNGGGNVSPHIIERLRREPVQVTVSRNGKPSFEPAEQIIGPKIALIDEYSASDGDIFAYRFRKHKLGTIIGKRSWGGVVGIRGSLPIVDGGFLNRPEFSRYNVEGTQWEIEGHGVDPDIVVENDPYKAFIGEDQQLDKAIELIKEQMKGKSYLEPAPPAYPKK